MDRCCDDFVETPTLTTEMIPCFRNPTRLKGVQNLIIARFLLEMGAIAGLFSGDYRPGVSLAGKSLTLRHMDLEHLIQPRQLQHLTGSLLQPINHESTTA
jgi:hypothetical protein